MKVAAIGHSHKLIGDIDAPKLVALIKSYLQAFGASEIITGLHPHIDLALGRAAVDMKLPLYSMPTFYDPFAKWPPSARDRGKVALYAWQSLGALTQLMAEPSEDATMIGNCNRISRADIVLTFCMDGVPGGTQRALEIANIGHATVIDLWTPYFNA